jgi:hypothetical protein
VDDETMYILVPTAQATGNADAADNTHTDDAQSSQTAFASDYDDNAIPVVDEAEVADEDPLEVHVLHDPLNPKIQKGELFPDIISFRKAIKALRCRQGF